MDFLTKKALAGELGFPAASQKGERKPAINPISLADSTFGVHQKDAERWGELRSNLQNVRFKNGIFIFRRKIPPALQDLMRQHEIIRSLGRCSARQARQQATQLWLQTERLFQMLAEFKKFEGEDEDLISPDQVQLFVDTMISLSTYNDHYVSTDPDHEKRCPIDRYLLQLEFWARQSRAALVQGDLKRIADEIQELSEQLKIPVRKGSKSEAVVGRALLRAEADFYDDCARRERQERGLPENHQIKSISTEALDEMLSEKIALEISKRRAAAVPQNESMLPLEIVVPPHPGSLAAKAKSLTLDPNAPASSAWDQYVADKKRVAKIKETPAKLRSSLNLWMLLFGDKPLDTWTSEKAQSLRRTYLLLPKDYARSPKWKEFGNIQNIAIQFQNEISTAPNSAAKNQLLASGVRHKTWNRHHSTLSGFWKWAKKNKLTGANSNPFDGLWIEPDSDDTVAEGGSEKRLNWEIEHLAELFASPLYTGCKSPRRRYLPGEYVVRDALYWVPLIVAYTGMRREEICQLKVKHLCQDDETGIWYFDLKAEGLRLKKTKKGDSASKRWVPVPDALIELELIAQLHADRDKEEQLFVDLYRSAAHDCFGDQLGKQFSGYRKNYDKHRRSEGGEFAPLYIRWMDLHSFRHTVCTELINCGVPQEHAEEITGHKSQARRTAFANYDKGRTLTILKNAIEKRALPISIKSLKDAAVKSPLSAANERICD